MNNNQTIREKATIAIAAINNMCNVTTTDEVINEFVKIKDLIIELYKVNIDRVNKDI